MMKKLGILALGIVGAVFLGLAASDSANGSLTIECNVCLNDDFQPNQPIRLAALFIGQPVRGRSPS
jgi:hypothetical protein